uniref:Protein Brevis radix-like 4 n=1 Tax=Anthurium amnicola TaxID=1678845 RepID=A0A1D1XX01_9ARAE
MRPSRCRYHLADADADARPPAQRLLRETCPSAGGMLTCIPCSKQLGGSLHGEPDDDAAGTRGTRRAVETLTAQVKELAVEGSAASESERNYYTYPWRSASASTPRVALRGEIEARLRALSRGDLAPSVRRRAEGGRVLAGEGDEDGEEEREWVAQVEPGVLITLVSLPRGKNHLRRIRFSQEMFNRWQAQRWWAENSDKVMELYNVQRFHRQGFPLPTPLRSDDESSKAESVADFPETPPLIKERLPRSLHRPTNPAGRTMSYSSSSDSLDHHHRPPHRHGGRSYVHHSGRPNLPSLDRVGNSSADASARTSSSSSAGDVQGREWVEEDEPGVYVTIRALPGGTRELRRVRFSRERFGEVHARLWWEENRARVLQHYL